jgi:3-oxoacyl-[acyl-carrier-protein] synthase III
MQEHIVHAAHQSAHEAIRAFTLDETELRAIAPHLAAPVIYDATAQHLAISTVQDLVANDFTRNDYTQLEALFIKEFVTEYHRLASQV